MALKNQDKIITYIKKSNYSNKDNLIKVVEENKNRIDENILYEIVKLIISMNIKNYNLEDIIDLYYMTTGKDFNNKDINLFYKILRQYLSNELSLENYEIAFKLFNDKNNVYYLIAELLPFLGESYPTTKVRKDIYLETICNYLMESRKYYLDEKAYLSSITLLIQKLHNDYLKDLNSYTNIDADTIIIIHMIEDRKHAGIYNIDDTIFDELNSKIDNLEKLNKNKVNNLLTKKLENLEQLAKQQEKKLDLDIKDDNYYSKIAEEKINSYKDFNGYDIIYKQKYFIKDEYIKLLKQNDMYLSKEDINYLRAYAYGLSKNNLDLVLKIYEKDPENTLSILYDKSITNKFDEKTYLSLFPRKKSMIIKYYKENYLDKLVKILKIDPYYNDLYPKDKLEEMFKWFNINLIAEQDDNFVKAINELEVSQFELYKMVLEKNPDFKFGPYSKYLINIDCVMILSKFINYDSNNQEILVRLLSLWDSNSLHFIAGRHADDFLNFRPSENNKNDFKSKSISEQIYEIVDKIYDANRTIVNGPLVGDYNYFYDRFIVLDDINLLKLLISDDFDITIDDYLKCNIEEQIELLNSFKEYENSKLFNKIKYKNKINNIRK